MEASWTNYKTKYEKKVDRVLICAGSSPVTGEFPAQGPVVWSFDVFFDLRLNKQWSKHWEDGDLRCHRTYYDVTAMISYTIRYQPNMALWRHIPANLHHLWLS